MPAISSSANHSFDKTNPLAIYDFSRLLIGQSLHSLFGEEAISQKRKGKGGLGQMVEEMFFGYEVNSKQDADFQEANIELKCTPLLQSKSDSTYRIKERLVCTMIDYFSLAETKFEDSHLLAKCRLMLLLFYLHVSGDSIYDYKFLYRILWQLPEKDLEIIRQDYNTIADKVRRGEAHLLSEGDTVYLGACRKGQKGDSPQAQPFSDIKANKRAFSLKPAYMRYVLSHVTSSGTDHFTNYSAPESSTFELVSDKELRNNTFESIILNRFVPYIGLDYLEICQKLGITPYQSKSKYADVAALIASDGVSKRLAKAEEFVKSGITMKTIRVDDSGMPEESMSFKNIDYCEVYDNDLWEESEAYEIFTTRFLFVVFKPDKQRTITVRNNRDGSVSTEQTYILDKVFFWTMPTDDLEIAREYWEDIRRNVITDNIRRDAFWKLSNHRKFHVRPKATRETQKAVNPNGGECNKFCYWFNAEYVKQIIDSE